MRLQKKKLENSKTRKIAVLIGIEGYKRLVNHGYYYGL